MPKKQDWTQFTRRVPIKASVKSVFNAWTSQDQLERWFLSQAEFTAVNGTKKTNSTPVIRGDTYEWKWHGSDHLAEGKVYENNGIDLLSFSFLGCDVTIHVKKEQGETLVELTQFKIPTDEESTMSTFVGCTRGWTFYLTNLKSILEGGIDLRNKNDTLVNVINT